jgi:hypothetical protein
MTELETGLVLVVFRPAEWPWEPVQPGVTANENRVLVVGTKRRGPKQPIEPLPEEWRGDGPPMHAATPRFVLEESQISHAAPHLVPLGALQAKQHAEAWFGGRQCQHSGRYAGYLGEDSYKFDMFVEKVFFRGEERNYRLYPIHDHIVRV